MAQVTKTILRDRPGSAKNMVGENCILREKRDGERKDWYVWSHEKTSKGFTLNHLLKGNHEISEVISDQTYFSLGDFVEFEYLFKGEMYTGFGHIYDFILDDENDHSKVVARVETHTLDPFLDKLCTVNIDYCKRIMSLKYYNECYPDNRFKALCRDNYMTRKHHHQEHPLTGGGVFTVGMGDWKEAAKEYNRLEFEYFFGDHIRKRKMLLLL